MSAPWAGAAGSGGGLALGPGSGPDALAGMRGAGGLGELLQVAGRLPAGVPVAAPVAAELLWRLASSGEDLPAKEARLLCASSGVSAAVAAFERASVGALGPLWVGRALWALNKLRRRPSLELHSAMVTAVWDDLPSYTMKDAGHALWGLGCCGRDLPAAFVRDALDTVLQRHVEGVEEKPTRRALLALGELPRRRGGGGEGDGVTVQEERLESWATEGWPVAEGVTEAEQVRLMELAPTLESLLFLFEHLSGGLGAQGRARALSLVAARLAERQREKKLFYREEGVGRMRSCLPDAELAANLPQLSVPDLVQLLQDLATVGLALPETLVKAEGLLAQRSAEVGAEDVLQVLRAFTLLGHTISKQASMDWQFRIVTEIEGLSPEAATRALWVFAKMDGAAAEDFYVLALRKVEGLKTESLWRSPQLLVEYLWLCSLPDIPLSLPRDSAEANLNRCRLAGLSAALAIDLIYACDALRLDPGGRQLEVLDSIIMNNIADIEPKLLLFHLEAGLVHRPGAAKRTMAILEHVVGRVEGSAVELVEVLKILYLRGARRQEALVQRILTAGASTAPFNGPLLVRFCYYALALGADLPDVHRALILELVPKAGPASGTEETLMLLYCCAMLQIPSSPTWELKELLQRKEELRALSPKLLVHAYCSCVVMDLHIPESMTEALLLRISNPRHSVPLPESDLLVLLETASILAKGGDGALLEGMGSVVRGMAGSLSGKTLARVLATYDSSGSSDEWVGLCGRRIMRRMVSNARSSSSILFVLNAHRGSLGSEDTIFALQQLVASCYNQPHRSTEEVKNLHSDRRLSVLYDVISMNVYAFPLHALIKVLHAAVLLRLDPGACSLEQIRRLIENTIASEVSPQAAVKLIWAYSRQSFHPGPDTWGAIQLSIKSGAAELRIEELTNAMRAFADLGMGPQPEILDRLETLFEEKVHFASARTLVIFLESLVKLDRRPEPASIRAYLKQLRAQIAKLTASEAAVSLWALVNLKILDKQLLHRLEGICRKGVRTLDPSSLSRLVWALSQTEGGVSPRTLEEIGNNWTVWADALDASQLCTVSWAFTVKGMDAPSGLIPRLIQALGFASEEQGMWSLADVPMEYLSYGLAAHARLTDQEAGGARGPLLHYDIAGAVIQALQQRHDEVSGLSPQAFMNVLKAHVLLRYSLGPKMEGAVFSWLESHLGDSSAHHLVASLDLLSELDLRATTSLSRLYKSQTIQFASQLSESDLRTLRTAFAAQGWEYPLDRRSSEAIHQSIIQAKTIGKVLEWVSFEGVHFGGDNCAMAMYQIARLSRSAPRRDRLALKSDSRLLALESLVQKNVADMGPDALSRTTWAYARLRLDASELVEVLQAQAIFFQSSMTPTNISSTLWAYVSILPRCGLDKSAKPLPHLEQQITLRAVNFSGTELATSCWAFAKLGYEPKRALVHSVQKAVLALESPLGSQETSMLLWAMAHFSVCAQDESTAGFLARMEPAIVSTGGRFASKGVANTVWALSQLGYQPENPLLLDTLCEVVHGRLGDMDPSLVLRTLSSLSRLGHCPSDSVLQAIWEQCQHYRASYTQREFTRLVALFNSFGHERRQRGGGSGDAFIMLPRKTPSAAPPP